MSKIALAPSASGTGTLTISAPNTNSDRILSLPDAAGTIQVSGNPISGTTGTFTGLVDISAAGAGQIQFPATQNASANANTLDDYEEGTWTPVIKFGSTTATQASTATSYTKVGRQVTCLVETYVTNLNGGTGAFELSGLPFNNLSMRSAQGIFYFQFMSSSFPDGDKMAFINAGTTTLGINYFTGSSGTALNLNNTHFTTSSYVYVQLVYFTT